MQDVVAWDWERMLVATAAMVGAVLLSLPLAFIYLRTRPPHEFDSSVLFSIVFLSATIAGIMVVVQGSLARALSLAGVVGAVRFRSSLKDSNDAVYLLGAIAVGIAAGSNELDVGVVISVLLSITLLLLWKARVEHRSRAGLVKDDNPRHGHNHHHHDSTEASVEGSASTAAEGNGTAPLGMRERPPALHRLGYIVVETEHSEQTRLLVETFLERETKSWRLDGASPSRDRHKHASGIATLMLARTQGLFPALWGIFGNADAGRVYVDGSSPGGWHSGVGGGVWAALLDRANTVSTGITKSHDQTVFYVGLGFPF